MYQEYISQCPSYTVPISLGTAAVVDKGSDYWTGEAILNVDTALTVACANRRDDILISYDLNILIDVTLLPALSIYGIDGSGVGNLPVSYGVALPYRISYVNGTQALVSLSGSYVSIASEYASTRQAGLLFIGAAGAAVVRGTIRTNQDVLKVYQPLK